MDGNFLLGHGLERVSGPALSLRSQYSRDGSEQLERRRSEGSTAPALSFHTALSAHWVRRTEWMPNKKLSQLDRTQMSKEQSRESCDTVVALGDVLLVMGNRTGLELPWLQ